VTAVAGVSVDWYRTSFAADSSALDFELGGEETAQLALQMLELDGWERILDLACATGNRTLELCRAGFDVIGIDVSSELLEVAGTEAEQQDLLPWFYEKDPRYMGFEREFDVVLSLGGGAFEHFDSDEENRRAFERAARALRPGGRLLMQTPNVMHVEAHLPPRTWFQAGETIELIEQHWNAPTHRLDGTRRTLVEFDSPQYCEPVPFQRRLYTIEELAEIFEQVGLRLTDVFDEQGRPCAPSDVERELYVEARA
jgi:SAM-dependent methyltransferase